MIAGGIILAAILLRLVLIGLGWPITNSDEGTTGIMALHIAYQGEHPTFFYGQHYMGSWEAFLGAFLFRVLGPSVFALRLGSLCMFAVFLTSTYLFTRLLFSRTWALITLLLVGITSGFVMTQEIRAIGGYAETLAFSSLLVLGSTWLALTYQKQMTERQQIQRLGVYLGWGLIAGLGLWTDQLILPAIFTAGLLILLVCWRELLKVFSPLALLFGAAAGAAPLILYNLHAPRSQNSLAVLQALRNQAKIPIYTLAAILKELHNTFQSSLPMITGEPFCPVSEQAFLAPGSPHTLACSLAHGGWSLSYTLLFCIAAVLALVGIWRVLRKRGQIASEPALQRELTLQLARLLLLVSALLTLMLYVFSSSSQLSPGASSRYLLCMLVATPAVFWPLWQGWQNLKTRADTFRRVWLRGLCVIALLGFCLLGLTGSILAFTGVADAQARNQNDARLIQELHNLGVSDIYTNYWTCDKLVLESAEHVVCAVLGKQMEVDTNPNHNRYSPYVTAVKHAQHVAYVFSTDPQQFPASGAYTALINPQVPISSLPGPYSTYTRIEITGYIIYLPTT